MVGLRGHGLDTLDDPHLLPFFQLGSAILMVSASIQSFGSLS